LNHANENAAGAFAAFKDKLAAFIRKRVRQAEDAEDILQEVFYQFARMDDLGKPVEQAGAWLYKVARNLIINRGLKKTVMPGDGDFMEEIADVLFDQYQTPETAYLRTLIGEEINAAIAALPADQREVFELTEFYDMPVKEIARNTGVPVNTLLSRKHYAVLKLRKALADLYAAVALD
jgi:RNA polymerase sigma factor (sigma-70 family)